MVEEVTHLTVSDEKPPEAPRIHFKVELGFRDLWGFRGF